MKSNKTELANHPSFKVDKYVIIQQYISNLIQISKTVDSPLNPEIRHNVNFVVTSGTGCHITTTSGTTGADKVGIRQLPDFSIEAVACNFFKTCHDMKYYDSDEKH